MTRFAFVAALALTTLAHADSRRVKPIKYQTLRYTGFGVANPARDQQVIADFKQGLKANESARDAEATRVAVARENEELRAKEAAQPKSPGQAPVWTPPADPTARIAELEQELATPLPASASRPEKLRRTIRERELYRLKHPGEAASEVGAGAADAGVQSLRGESVIVLVDSLPSGIDVKDGRISANGSAELLGRFTAETSWVEEEAVLIEELKVLADAAGGNIVVLSFAHQREPQGRCHGAVGLVIRDLAFDPRKVTQGRLPSEI